MYSAKHPQRPRLIGIGGLTSNVGKTTLVCDLLKFFRGWEAIKTTRGHYRSCGKDPHTCCVSDLLETEPVIRSGREFTYTAGKDTGRYWDAGAANVHWVVATDEQVSAGIKTAVERVKSSGVIVEGNSFTEHVRPDCFVMVARADNLKSKASARRALGIVSAYFISGELSKGAEKELEQALRRLDSASSNNNIPTFTQRSLLELVALLQYLTADQSKGFQANPTESQSIISGPLPGLRQG